MIRFMARLRRLFAGTSALAILLLLILLTASPGRALADGGKEHGRETGSTVDALHRMDDDDGVIGIEHDGEGGGPDGNGGPDSDGDDTTSSAAAHSVKGTASVSADGSVSVSADGSVSVSADGSVSISADVSASLSPDAIDQPGPQGQNGQSQSQQPQRPGQQAPGSSQPSAADGQSRVLGAQATPEAGTSQTAAGALPAAGQHGSSGVNEWAIAGGLSLAGIAAGLAALGARLRRSV
jgi:hypothetical protein